MSIISKLAAIFAVLILKPGVSWAGTPIKSQNAEMKTEYAIIELAVEKRAFLLNCPLRIKLTSRKAPLYVQLILEQIPLCSLKLRSETGRDCEYTSYGTKVLTPSDHFGVYTQEIPRGASKEWTLPLEKFFLLSPGKWTVEFEMDVKVRTGPDNLNDHRVKCPLFEITISPNGNQTI